ncbi:polyprotein [Gossypium australe]|uniref:Polyprotein n=1 Tax=Gossypium australe TaxID=47621 RepID=A0A5B6WFF3_9ROSI|nr:polyprotein [Gossypium australe]
MGDLKKKKTGETGSSVTGCGSHICTNVQGLTRSGQLKKGEVYLQVGNGVRLAALAVGSYELTLPSGLLLDLNNGFYVPSISRNTISDVFRPLSSIDRGGYKYFITFTDDFSRYGYVYLMRHKFKSFEVFKSFQNEAQNQLGKKIKAF